MKYPRIYLVLDNCFAIKRWVKPSEWMEIARDIGFSCVQASTDNEIDPLFSPKEYADDWFEEVKRCEKANGVKVVNFYTGYQTYRTVGLAHHDERVRRKLMDGWLKPLVRRIAGLKAKGMGFSYFAIPDGALQDPVKYEETTKIIIGLLGELSEYAYENGEVQISFEQMYSPHQPPWTIEGTKNYLKDILKVKNRPMYVTLDVGHMAGQKRFLMPSKSDIMGSLLNAAECNSKSSLWLGSDIANEKFTAAIKKYKSKEEMEAAVNDIYTEMQKCSYFFSEEKDGDIYKWVEELACYSPIIHMQQTDGKSSSHAAFTPETNRNGVVTGELLLEAIAKSYQRQYDNGMPPLVKDIYLSFEIFASNVETKWEIITKLKQTLAYWRKYVPEDGTPLGELL